MKLPYGITEIRLGQEWLKWYVENKVICIPNTLKEITYDCGIDCHITERHFENNLAITVIHDFLSRR